MAGRTPIVVGNWKLQKTIAESLALVTELKNHLASVRDVEMGVAPVFTAVHAVSKRLEDTGLSADLVAELLLKTFYAQGELSALEVAREVALPFIVVDPLVAPL